MTTRETVANFWKGVDEHDWDLVASTISDDFVRIGMRDDEADTSRGKEDYMRFVSEVTGRMDHHALEMVDLFFSDDGRTAVAECIETIHPPGEPKLVMRFINILKTIHPPGEPKLVMRFINILKLNDDDLIEELDIFWKTPPRMPPEWITPEAILED